MRTSASKKIEWLLWFVDATVDYRSSELSRSDRVLPRKHTLTPTHAERYAMII